MKCSIGRDDSLTSGGKEDIRDTGTQKHLRQSDCELRLLVIRIRCTVATFPPKEDRQYLLERRVIKGYCIQPCKLTCG